MGKNMKRWLCMVMIYCLFASFLFSGERTIPFFVSTQWLSEHLNDNDVVTLQVGFSRNEFKYAHVPNARFVWFNSLAVSTPDLSTEMPTVKEAKKVLEELGVAQNSKIVLVFTGQNVTTTTRIVLALSYFGFGNQTAFLDGGLEMWKKEGRPISKETPVVKKTTLTLKINPSVLTNADWVKDHLSSPNVTIVDARTKNFYDGFGGGVARQGHISGAKSLPYTTIVDSTNKIKPVNELQKLFDNSGIPKGNTIVIYCHVGQQATLVYCAAKYLGYDVKVYDGCFEDWNMRDDSFPVEKLMQ